MGTIELIPSIAAVKTGFSPLSLPGLVGWWSFDDATYLWKDTARTSAVTVDSDIIKGVTDRSGNGNHMSEATNGPTWKTAIQNGLGIARFDGVNNVLTASAISQAQPNTVVLVAKIVTDESPSSTELLDGVGARQIIYKDSATGKWSLYAGTLQPGATITADTSYHVHYVVFNGASSVYRVDQAAAFATVNPGAGSLTPLVLGFATPRYYNIEYGDVILCSGALSTGDRGSVESWAKAKWGTP